MSLIAVAALLGLTTGLIGIISLSTTVIHLATAGASIATIVTFISGDTMTVIGGTEILGAIVTAIMFIMRC